MSQESGVRSREWKFASASLLRWGVPTCLEPAQQCRQHPSHFIKKAASWFDERGTHHGATHDQLEVCIEFSRRPSRYGDEARIVTATESPYTLGDVRGNGRGGAPHLRRQAKSLERRQLSSQGICVHCESHRLLPDGKVTMRTDHRMLRNWKLRRSARVSRARHADS